MSESETTERTDPPSPLREAAPGGLDDGPDTSPPYGWALAATAVVFTLYALTLAPTTAFWDASEYIATGHILGIPHPPGNPLFVLLARTWEVLLAPLGLTVPVRINLFSAFVSASAHGLWFLVVHHVLRYFSRDRFFRLGGAFAAVMVSATAFTVWNQSNVNEKVYTVSLLTIALLSWLAFRWQENLGKGKDDNLLVLMAFILALSVGNHLMAFLAAPAIFVFVLMVHPRTLLNWKLYPAVLVAAVAGLTVHLFLPIRAGLDPIINEADPTCPGVGDALASIVTYGKAGCAALSEALTRDQYQKPPLVPRQAPILSQYLNYLQYFDWQWARSVQGKNVLFADLRVPFTMLFTGLGVWGALEHLKRDKPSFWYVAVLFATLSIALTFYLNFRYGYSIPDATGSGAHEVRERDYFFIVSFSVWGLWAGIGVATVWKWLGDNVARGSYRKASPILLVAAIPLVLNWSWADRSYDWAARDWAYALLMSVEPYGVLFTNGDNDTFPLWYLQEVEGIRQDVTVIVTSYLNTAWYTKQLRDLTAPCPEGVSAEDDRTRIICQRKYETDGRALYTADPAAAADSLVVLELSEPVREPTRSVLELPDSTIDRVAGAYVPMEQGRVLDLGPVEARLRAGQLLYPWHQYALAIVNTGIQDGRPIHFASSGNAAVALGLERYLIRQGLAFKLHEGPLPETAPPGVEPMPGDSPLVSVTGRWVDVPRTAMLVDSVFVHHGDIPDWDHWPDASTIGIPNYFAWAYYALAQSAYQQGDAGSVDRWSTLGDAWTELGN